MIMTVVGSFIEVGMNGRGRTFYCIPRGQPPTLRWLLIRWWGWPNMSSSRCVTSTILEGREGALRAETEIDTKNIPRRFRASPHVRGTLVKPGDQILDPQVVVPYYTKNQKTDFLAIFSQFLPLWPQNDPQNSPVWQKVALISDFQLKTYLHTHFFLNWSHLPKWSNFRILLFSGGLL